MPLESGTLYGTMAGSMIIHAAFPILVAVLISTIPGLSLPTKVILFLAVGAFCSFLTQFGMLIILQSSSCSGVKSYKSIFAGAGIGSIVTAALTAVPLYVEPLRLVVSQLFATHHSLLTPKMREINDIITHAAQSISNPDHPTDFSNVAELETGTTALTPEQYEDQTVKEMMMGAAYFSAFAGAYGVAMGSMVSATTCPPVAKPA